MRLLPGARLGPYEIVAPLGAGGMGEVYRARDPRLSREVAIKVLPADRLADPDRRRRFVQEAQAASALNHPHIVTIHEIESADGAEFIVMEYVRGKSLDGEDTQKHLWMIDADGGAPRRLTAEAGEQVVPTWSQDGRWIYYSWWQANTRDIWRLQADGGAPERLTHGAGGAFACESADGKSLLFQPKDADSPLMIMELPSGHARQLVACVRNSAFGVGSRGVYTTCPAIPSPTHHYLCSIRRLVETCASADWTDYFQRPLGLSVSPDGNTIIYPRQVFSRADLMLIENFK